jgi:hypothetical protein
VKVSEQLPVVARLYTTGMKRRYRRASTQSGPGDPLCLVADAEALLARERHRYLLLSQAAGRLLDAPTDPERQADLRQALGLPKAE